MFRVQGFRATPPEMQQSCCTAQPFYVHDRPQRTWLEQCFLQFEEGWGYVEINALVMKNQMEDDMEIIWGCIASVLCCENSKPWGLSC